MPGSSFLIVRGLIGIVIGVLAFLWPGLTMAILVGIFAVYAFVDGVTNLVLGFTGTTRRERSWASVFQGLIGIAAGVIAFARPGITMLALLWLIAAWAIVTGILEIVAAIRLRREITGEWMLMLSGILSVLFGVLIFGFPGAGAVGISWMLGAYAAAAGIALVALGIRLRSHAHVMA